METSIKNKCKSFTSVEQSKQLAKILPIESADMRYGYIAPYDYSDRMYDGGYDEIPYPKDFLKKNPNFSENEYDGELPAWSLAALLEIMPHVNNIRPFNLTKMWEGGEYNREHVKYVCTYYYTHNTESDNPIDACVEMIVKLKEKGLI